MKTLRKRLAGLLALLCLFCAGCGGEASLETAAATPSPLTAAERAEADAFLAGWLDALLYIEGECGDLLWAADYADAFLAKPEWNALLLARVAASSGFADVSRRGLTGGGLPPLPERAQGAPAAGAAELLYADGGAGERASFLDAFLILSCGLDASVFHSADLAALRAAAETERAIAEATLDRWALLTEDLLLRLDDAALSERWQAALAEGCPRIAAKLRRDRDDSAMEAAIAETEARLEALRRAREALPATDGTAGDAVEIAGLAATLPMPNWETTYAVRRSFYWEDRAGAVTTALPGETLSDLPTGCRIEWPGVGNGALEAYCEYLADRGIVPLDAPAREGGAFEVCFSGGGTPVLFRQVKDTITADMPQGVLCFVPDWYLPKLTTVTGPPA